MKTTLLVILAFTLVSLVRQSEEGTVYEIWPTCGSGYGVQLAQATRVPSIVRCSTLCEKHADCSSFIYDDATKACYLHDGVVGNVSSLPTNCGKRYGQIELCGGLSRIGYTCSASAECTVSNSTCLDGICKCEPGLSYDPRTCTCVFACTTYGNTFQELQHSRIITLNDVTDNSGLSLVECMDLCLTTTSIVCRSIDFRSNNECHLSVETIGTRPENYDSSSPLYTHYQRDCAL